MCSTSNVLAIVWAGEWVVARDWSTAGVASLGSDR